MIEMQKLRANYLVTVDQSIGYLLVLIGRCYYRVLRIQPVSFKALFSIPF